MSRDRIFEEMARASKVVWFRRDLRVVDHPALNAAIRLGGPVVPVFVWAPEESGEWRLGSAARWWLRRSLEALERELRELGSGLTLLYGSSVGTLPRFCEHIGADAVFWNRHHEPTSVAIEARLEAELRRLGLDVSTFEAVLLSSKVRLNRSGRPFQRFTPFYKAFLAEGSVPIPVAKPRSIPSREHPSRRETRQVLDAISEARSDMMKLADWWSPGSESGRQLLERFLTDGIDDYSERHDRLDTPGTSRLSPHLSFGEVSAREVWHAASRSKVESEGAKAFRRQLVWREFAYQELLHFPQITDTALKTEFESMPSVMNEDAFVRWEAGLTGYPIVDAGMRQLGATGWMPNRVRMVVASFLIKHLGLPWQIGAHSFWNHLVDADLANNSLNWQWVAGSAADAAPYYRIFNPTRQGERFDPQGTYVKRWVPELGPLSGLSVHTPWTNEEVDLDYPEPIVDHAAAREAALERYALVRQRKGDR